MDKQEVEKLIRIYLSFKFFFDFFIEIYSMAGVEEKLGREVYISDETEGIIPRAGINNK